MVEVKSTNTVIAETTPKVIGRPFLKGVSGNPGGKATIVANTWKRLHAIFDRELAIEVPYSGTTMAKECLLVRSIIDGAIARNPACLKVVAQICFPKSTNITNIDARQVNVVGGLLERLAKVESAQVLVQSHQPEQPELLDVKADVISDE